MDVTITMDAEDLFGEGDELEYRIKEAVVEKLAKDVLRLIDRPLGVVAREIEKVAVQAFEETARAKLEAALQSGAAAAWGFENEAELDHWVAINLRARLGAPVKVAGERPIR